MTTYNLTITFTEPILGTVTGNEELYTDFIAAKAAEAVDDELETIPDLEKGTTGFHRDDGKPFLYDYVIKGFFKDACGMLSRSSESRSNKLRAYKKIIDGLVFPEPRRIPLLLPNDDPLKFLERPLRAQTAQGERVALSRSEMAPVGTSLKCQVYIEGGAVPEATLREWLDYGARRGLGQWRNGGYGRFIYELSQA